jgi:type IV secretory pathway TrbD component
VHLAALAQDLAAHLAAAAVKLKPDPNALPGIPTAETLANGLAAAILLACLIGGLFGIGQWVLGSRTSNFSQADSGKGKVGAAVLGAFGVGAFAAIINFFVNVGGQVK